MRAGIGIMLAVAAALLVWMVGDTPSHAPLSPPGQPVRVPPPWLRPALASAMAALVVAPTALGVRRAAHGFPARYQLFACFAAVVRLSVRFAAGFIGGLSVEVFLRHGLNDAGQITRATLLAAAWHGSTVAALLSWGRASLTARRQNRTDDQW